MPIFFMPSLSVGEGQISGSAGVLQANAIQECDPCVIAAAGAIETIIEDPLLPILEEDSNITKPPRQIRRPGLDHNPTTPRFELFMIDLIPHPKISVFFNVRPYFRTALSFSLRKKSFQSSLSRVKYTPFPSLSASRI
jgi:hypothetical protein